MGLKYKETVKKLDSKVFSRMRTRREEHLAANWTFYFLVYLCQWDLEMCGGSLISAIKMVEVFIRFNWKTLWYTYISFSGTFLIIYFIAMFACGIPVFFQVSLNQFLRRPFHLSNPLTSFS